MLAGDFGRPDRSTGVIGADSRYSNAHTKKEGEMGWLDKLLGRVKKASGDVTGNEGRWREGRHQEAEGVAEDRADVAERQAQEAREQAAEHRAERETP
jgi:uncharacterized protein YjbJ (UPF0337 family)